MAVSSPRARPPCDASFAIRCYPCDYQQARDAFCATTQRFGGRLAEYELPGRGARGERLVIDVARIGSETASCRVLISSGLHGVEGFVGSAIQQAWLQSTTSQLREFLENNALEVVLIHALNPYGFSWGRRVDADNIDLNRNFLLPAQAYAGAPQGYRELNRFLNPTGLPGHWDCYRLTAARWILRRGVSALKEAIASGQYDFPYGLFFGGQQATAATRVVHEQSADWIGKAGHVVHLDLHSGLGRWGHCRLLMPVDETRLRPWCAELFGLTVLDGTEAAKRVSYPTRGTLVGWFNHFAGDCDYRGLVAEFGTYSPIRVLGALRAENRVHHSASEGRDKGRAARHELLECFCPGSRHWRVKVVHQGLTLIERAIAGCLDAARQTSPIRVE
ncbi:MAG: DUF2817 domain-containing protein [Planctomycetota bacterium]|nr:DUF2817 domain-containing protein [Planctomycetota bacterium]